MLKVFEYMNAADLPITEIDENATLVMYIDDVGLTETVIQIKVNNETVRIDPATISVSLESKRFMESLLSSDVLSGEFTA